jgi:glyoxylase-like metal-dependent hydrolase (beta-lactamase superfamily II)
MAIGSGKLDVRVFTSAPESFSVTSTLFSGERDAVLVDAQFALPEAERVADEITSSGKRLTTVYITHWHPDHYFGLPAILAAHPGARAVALPETVAEIRGSVTAKLAQWKPVVGDLIPDEPVIPQPLTETLHVEGEPLEIAFVGQGDTERNSAVYVPAADTLVTGDLAYNRAHVWMVETSPEQWEEWLGSLDTLEAIGASRVVAGHRALDAPDDPSVFEGTRRYIRDFAVAVKESSTKQELVQKVMARHGDRALEVILGRSASAVFPGERLPGA